MTHRSRSGGPQAQHVQRKKRDGGAKKPPPWSKQAEDAAANTTPPPESHPLSTLPTTFDILALIRHSLAPTITSPGFGATVQKIKGLLYEKKWLEAFGDEGLLDAYAGRWVPSRVLCFRELLAETEELREFIVGKYDEDEGEAEEGEAIAKEEESKSMNRIVSLGGGAGSEVLAIASLIHGQRLSDRRNDRPVSNHVISWVGVDFGPWSSVLDKFSSAFSSLWHLDLPAPCHQMNLLEPASPNPLLPLISGDTGLVTLIFTICELMSQSRPGTIRLIRDLTANLRSGGLLLVADSASDIAEFELGSSGRKWPVYMVLDAMLLGTKDAEGKAQWKKLDSDDSRWFRLPEGVADNWPVKLENTRYWYRLYRRV
jgi:25S rRNA (uracil2843-N3)-methyltransferase